MRLTQLLFILLLAISPKFLLAINGDTTLVKVHNRTHLNWNGNFDKWGYFNNQNKSFQRVWLKYTIGCPDKGCSEWDYTTRVIARKRTGIIDSTLKQAPFFKVDNTIKDTLFASTLPTYDYSFNSTTKQTDSVEKKSYRITFFTNSQFPTQQTDTAIFWPARYYTYNFDTAGIKTDSNFVTADTTLVQKYTPYYDKFEKIDEIELAKVITPYAGGYTKTWSNDFWFDITDYQTLFNKDSVQIRVNYGGWQDGFTAYTDFYFIEGKPAREVIGIVNLWNGSHPFGVSSNPMEKFLNLRRVAIPQGTALAQLRVTPSGHGFGGSDGCAEFCKKKFFVKVNNNQIAEQLIWKDDCGLNPHYPQPGTWLYDRANWCPGTAAKTYSFDITPPSTDSFDLQIELEPYVNQGNNNQSYIIGSHVIFYKNNANYAVDASLEDILSPSKDFKHNRYNPICGNAKVLIKNFGSTKINTVKFSCKIEDQPEQIFNWTDANLDYLKSAEVLIPYLNWTSAKANAKFEVKIIEVNGVADENPNNNIKTSVFDLPVQTPLSIIVETKTNNNPQENKLLVTNSEGKVILEKTFTVGNTWHRDTLVLGHGCYSLILEDLAGDGLDFFANASTAGKGVFRIMNTQPYSLLRNFNANFGRSIVFNFTAGMALGSNKLIEEKPILSFYPNPANQTISVLQNNLSKNQQITITDLTGKLKYTGILNTQELTIDISHIKSGLYFISLIQDNITVTQKFIKE